jgi:alkylhydroperoxidase family enzyme
LRATLGFLEKLTLSPSEMRPEDVVALRSEGLDDQMIADAIYVCVGFNIINRIADALGFKVPPPKVFTTAAKFLLVFGYQMLSGVHLGSIGKRFPRRDYAGQLNDDSAPVRHGLVADPYAEQLERLKDAVLRGPGVLDPELRKAACEAGEMSGAMGSYVKKVVRHAHEVTDEDIAGLRQSGWSEDEIFEITVSAALGAGLVRLEAGLAALCNKYSPAVPELARV